MSLGWQRHESEVFFPRECATIHPFFHVRLLVDDDGVEVMYDFYMRSMASALTEVDRRVSCRRIERPRRVGRVRDRAHARRFIVCIVGHSGG